MKSKIDRANLILGCPYDGDLMGLVSDTSFPDKVPVAALHSYDNNPIVAETDVLRCSKCQRTFLVSEVSWEQNFPEVTLLEV